MIVETERCPYLSKMFFKRARLHGHSAVLKISKTIGSDDNCEQDSSMNSKEGAREIEFFSKISKVYVLLAESLCHFLSHL